MHVKFDVTVGCDSGESGETIERSDLEQEGGGMAGELKFPTRQRCGVTPTVTGMSQNRINVTPVEPGESTKTNMRDCCDRSAF